MRLHKKFIALIILSSIVATSYSDTLPENHAVNGGVTIVPIDIKQKPDVFFDNKRIAVSQSPNKNQWLLVVGVPLNKDRPVQQLTMTKPYKATIPFHISDKFYKTQSLTINNKRKVDPYEKDRARINSESKKLAQIFSKYTKHDPFIKGFKAPSYGPISSLFGLKRVYNNKPRAPHTGLDIASPENSPVHVVSPGRVVETGNYFFTGNTVIVDHGMGVFSLYAHLKEMDVKPGAKLKQGDVVGKVGMTGRATGPHLHWSMIMNQTYVDPLLFVPARLIRTNPDKPHPKKESSKVSKDA